MDVSEHLLGCVRRAAADYNMIKGGDSIAVGLSGGKDSTALLYLLARLREFLGVDFMLCGITVDMGLHGMDFAPLADFCDKIGVPYYTVKTEISRIIFEERREKNPCSLCAKMRRGALHAEAKSRGCNKIALGHHFNDVIETTMLGMLYGSQLQAMIPKLHSQNFAGMELIRPLYCVREDDIIEWARYCGLDFIRCACRFTEKNGDGVGDSKRMLVKRLLSELKKDNPVVETSVFNSIHAVSLDTFPAYKTDGELHSFLERYGKNQK